MINKLSTLLVGIALTTLILFAGLQYKIYQIKQEPLDLPIAAVIDLPPVEEAREFIIRGEFILTLALEEFLANPSSDMREAIEVITVGYTEILDSLCTDPRLAYSCTEGFKAIGRALNALEEDADMEA